MNDWQTPAALVVVAMTFTIFIVRLARKKKSKGTCGSGCDCPVSKPEK